MNNHTESIAYPAMLCCGYTWQVCIGLILYQINLNLLDSGVSTIRKTMVFGIVEALSVDHHTRLAIIIRCSNVRHVAFNLNSESFLVISKYADGFSHINDIISSFVG